MSSLTLDELDRVGVHRRMSHDAARRLRATGLIEAEPVGNGAWRLYATGKVGAATVEDIDVTVMPKDGVPVSHILFLLAYAKNAGLIDDLWASSAYADSLPEVLADAFARAASSALRLGPLQGYVTRGEELVTVRGRINHDEQMRRRQGMILPTNVTYDDYSLDIAENQILRGAALSIAGTARVRPATRATLRHVAMQLDGVSPARAGQRLPPWRPTRLNQRYRTALHIGELILAHMSLDLGSGAGRSLSALAVDMAVVFEDFLTTALNESARRRGIRLSAQHRAHLDRRRVVPMRPDVVQLVDGGPVAIIDAKYKASREVGARNADAYQMLAYCTALGVSEAWLVHAGGNRAAGESDPILVRGADVTIRQWTLDLASPPAHILAQVEELCDRVFV